MSRPRRPGTAPAVVPPAQITNATSRGTYTGRELQPYDGRPGAMDAFRLPSRVGSQLIAPRAVREGLL